MREQTDLSPYSPKWRQLRCSGITFPWLSRAEWRNSCVGCYMTAVRFRKSWGQIGTLRPQQLLIIDLCAAFKWANAEPDKAATTYSGQVRQPARAARYKVPAGCHYGGSDCSSSLPLRYKRFQTSFANSVLQKVVLETRTSLAGRLAVQGWQFFRSKSFKVRCACRAKTFPRLFSGEDVTEGWFCSQWISR